MHQRYPDAVFTAAPSSDACYKFTGVGRMLSTDQDVIVVNQRTQEERMRECGYE